MNRLLFKKNLGKSEWKMLLQVSAWKWNGIGLSEIPIWCGILKREMSCQQVGLFHSHQTHFVLTFLCSKFLEFFTPQTFHLPVLILQQFAIGQHFPLDGSSISCADPGLTLQRNRKMHYKQIAEWLHSVHSRSREKPFLFIFFCISRVVLCYLYPWRIVQIKAGYLNFYCE